MTTPETKRQKWDMDLVVKYYLDHPGCKPKDLIQNLQYGSNTIYARWSKIVSEAEKSREVSSLKEEKKQKVTNLT